MWASVRPAVVLLVLSVLAFGRPVRAQAPQVEASPSGSRLVTVPTLRPLQAEGALLGQPIARIEIVSANPKWFTAKALRYVKVGESLTPAVARRALRELLTTGRYAEAGAEAEMAPEGVVLRLCVVPRRIVGSLKLRGPLLDDDEIKEATAVSVGSEITWADLAGIREKVRAHYATRGFPAARVDVEALDTDDPLRVSLVLSVATGKARTVRSRVFLVEPKSAQAEVSAILGHYAVAVGDRLDSSLVEQADTALSKDLVLAGWHNAKVTHSLGADGAALRISVQLGRRAVIEFEGNSTFDASQLLAALDLEEREDRQPESLRQRLADFYVRRGFWDANVEIFLETRGSATAVAYRFRIVEGVPLRVSSRVYPCLTGARTGEQLDAEINSFLVEDLPGPGLYTAVNSRSLDALIGPKNAGGERPRAYRPNPVDTYVPEVYDRALKHVQGLYRSAGYLSATVGPLQLMRRRCAPGSTPSQCRPLKEQTLAAAICSFDERGLPLEQPPVSDASACRVNLKTGVLCEAAAVLSIPIKLGPLTTVYDVSFEGNRTLTEQVLALNAGVKVGEPASQSLLDAARARLLELYAEEGFAFADIETNLDLSVDQTRARVRFSVIERERVRVARIVVKGARLTNENLIRGRIALVPGELYRRTLVRQTEERLATLGVFSSVTVGFEDPEVFARDKVVVVEVAERTPQYLEPQFGFSSGEGFRGTLEYGHRNLGGQAIQLTLRARLNYLPDGLILEPDVRRKRPAGIAKQLERNNSLVFLLPEVGLGPLFGLSLEGIDLRDNARDYGLVKDAGIINLGYRPSLRVSAQVGGSLEFNDATIFFDGDSDAEKQRLSDFIRANPSQRDRFRVPQGETRALTERIAFRWDRRDTPLDATSGTLTSVDVEHVNATPIGERASTNAAPAGGQTAVDPFESSRGDFFRITQRTAGYLRLNDSGLALALSLGWGVVVHTNSTSQTYPDRLFFMGGVDSIRGFPQDSVVPEDVARRVVTTDSNAGSQSGKLTLRDVVIRGGDIFVNPRSELRIPLTGSLKTAIFIDTGNVWTAPVEVLRAPSLRYSVGTGLRVATPVGPLVFDYGVNLERLFGSRRPWEDVGAFNFSIGVF
ncbi:MAG: POTRA domain-containing protein [Polyangiaceae bacterium]|nr:POTRA domain-containing protein [Polyangiaceae bacterium]